MTSFDAGLTLADRFRRHAQDLASAPLYAELMRAMADDWEAGGPVREICAGWQDAPSGTVVQLRLLAGLHRIVLRREAPALATYFRSVGGGADPAEVWAVAGARRWLSDCWMPCVGDVQPLSYAVVERRGCDLSPVDASTEAGRLLLTSFVWPDHLHRFERLRSALDVAGRRPVRVERAAAGQWLEQVLADPVPDDVLTVVWHSITRMYWPDEEVRRGERDDRQTLLAAVGDHGMPVQLGGDVRVGG